MKRRRKRSKQTRNDIGMAYRIERLPKPIPKEEFFDTLIEFLDGDRAVLPNGWIITWRWQNSKKQNWREGEFTEVVSKSRSSFMSLMRRRLKRDLDRLRPARRGSKRSRAKGKRRRKKKGPRRLSKVHKTKARRRKPRRVR